MKKVNGKLNKKGFLLAELIVVGVFVLTLFTFIFVNLVPLVQEYDIRENYDTINGVYNANLIRNMIISDDNFSNVLGIIKSTGATEYPYSSVQCKISGGRTTYCEFKTIDSLCDLLKRSQYCKILLGPDYIDVETIYLTWYHTDAIKGELGKNYFDKETSNYINTMDDYANPTGVYDNYKRLIIKYSDGTFANIEIRKK